MTIKVKMKSKGRPPRRVKIIMKGQPVAGSIMLDLIISKAFILKKVKLVAVDGKLLSKKYENKRR